MPHPATRPVFPHLGNLCQLFPLHLALKWDHKFVSSSVAMPGAGCIFLLLLRDRAKRPPLPKVEILWPLSFCYPFSRDQGMCPRRPMQCSNVAVLDTLHILNLRRYISAFPSAVFCKFCEHQARGTACSTLIVFQLSCQLPTTLDRISTHMILPAWTLLKLAEIVPLVRSILIILIVHVKVKQSQVWYRHGTTTCWGCLRLKRHRLRRTPSYHVIIESLALLLSRRLPRLPLWCDFLTTHPVPQGWENWENCLQFSCWLSKARCIVEFKHECVNVCECAIMCLEKSFYSCLCRRLFAHLHPV